MVFRVFRDFYKTPKSIVKKKGRGAHWPKWRAGFWRQRHDQFFLLARSPVSFINIFSPKYHTRQIEYGKRTKNQLICSSVTSNSAVVLSKKRKRKRFFAIRKKMLTLLYYYDIHTLYIEFHIVATSKSDHGTRCWLFVVCIARFRSRNHCYSSLYTRTTHPHNGYIIEVFWWCIYYIYVLRRSKKYKQNNALI